MRLRALQFGGGKGGAWRGQCVGDWIAKHLWRSVSLDRSFIHMGNQAGQESRRLERLWMNYPPIRPGIFG